MRLRLVREPFDNPDYIFELKHDGFRAIAYLQNGESKLVSRNQRNLGFEALKRSPANLPVENAIIDGEVICVDAKGVSQFNQLLSRKGKPVFCAFDLLWLDGEDLTRMPPRTRTSLSRLHVSPFHRMHRQEVAGENELQQDVKKSPRIWLGLCRRIEWGAALNRRADSASELLFQDNSNFSKAKSRCPRTVPKLLES